MSPTTTCKRCGQPIVWLVNLRNNHRLPVNPEPCPEGVVTIETGRTWDGLRYARRHATPEVAASTGLTRPRFRPHTDTCKPTRPKTRRKK